jgi:hypothetical protein
MMKYWSFQVAFVAVFADQTHLHHLVQVRLQLEALLAEKSRLAQENANLTRENQGLMQLVEYHQLASQDLDESYEDVMQGIRLDFSSPLGKISDDEEGERDDEVPVTPAEVPCSPDE